MRQKGCHFQERWMSSWELCTRHFIVEPHPNHIQMQWAAKQLLPQSYDETWKYLTTVTSIVDLCYWVLKLSLQRLPSVWYFSLLAHCFCKLACTPAESCSYGFRKSFVIYVITFDTFPAGWQGEIEFTALQCSTIMLLCNKLLLFRALYISYMLFVALECELTGNNWWAIYKTMCQVWQHNCSILHIMKPHTA